MDSQNKQPEVQAKPAIPQEQADQTEPKLVPTTTAMNEEDKPKVEMNDAQIEALLMLTDAHSSTQPKKKLPLGLIFTIIVLVILLSMAGPLISHVTKKGSDSQKSAGTTSQQKSASQSTTDEVNNDVQQCQNVANALSEC